MQGTTFGLLMITFVALINFVDGIFAIKNKRLRWYARGSYANFEGKDAQIIGVILIVGSSVIGVRSVLSLLNVPQDITTAYDQSVVLTVVLSVIVVIPIIIWKTFVIIINSAISLGRYLGRVYKIPISQDEPSGWGKRKRKSNEKRGALDELQ